MGNTFESHPCFHTSGYQRRPNPPRAKRRRSLESWRGSHSTMPGRTIMERHSMPGLILARRLPCATLESTGLPRGQLSRDGTLSEPKVSGVERDGRRRLALLPSDLHYLA